MRIFMKILLSALFTVSLLFSAPTWADEAGVKLANAVLREFTNRGYEPKNVIVRDSYSPGQKFANGLSVTFGFIYTLRMTEFDGFLPNTQFRAHFACELLIEQDKPVFEVHECEITPADDGKPNNKLFRVKY